MTAILTINIIALSVVLLLVTFIFIMYLMDCKRFEKKECKYQQQIDYYIRVLQIKAQVRTEGNSHDLGDKR